MGSVFIAIILYELDIILKVEKYKPISKFGSNRLSCLVHSLLIHYDRSDVMYEIYPKDMTRTLHETQAQYWTNVVVADPELTRGFPALGSVI